VYLPGRNLFLLTHAAVYAADNHLSSIAIGLLGSNPFGDARLSFLKQTSACLSQALSRPIRILTPLRRTPKAQHVARADGQPLHLTFSCLKPRGLHHCGCCNKCAERKRVFRDAGRSDPTLYAT